MTLVGILAALIPASRAAGVDSMTVLREEADRDPALSAFGV
jgi:hypothetical protein